MKENGLRYFIIGTFVTLYFIVSVISTIHVIDFFKLSNPSWLAISLAIAFEIGAAASLASLIALDKMNKTLVWGLFITLTLMQMMGNTYYAFTNLHDYQSWVDLFGLTDEEPIYQKRILSIISGAVLPLVALGFIKSLVDYIKPDKISAPIVNQVVEETPVASEKPVETTNVEEPIPTPIVEVPPIIEEKTPDLEISQELTPQDLETYKKKSIIKNDDEGTSLHIIPGVNV
jgi:hypothetical protein